MKKNLIIVILFLSLIVSIGFNFYSHKQYLIAEASKHEADKQAEEAKMHAMRADSARMFAQMARQEALQSKLVAEEALQALREEK